MDTPIFIVGANRSGTTLLRLILNAHPRIAVPDELIYLDSSLAGVPIEHWRDPGLSTEEYETFVDRFLTENCRSLDELDMDVLREEILAGPHDFRRPYRCALEAWAGHHGKDRWGEKTPGNLFYADILLEMFPRARFLYMVRDPRAGVASMQRVSFFPEDTAFNALSRRKHDTEGRALLERHVPAAQRQAIRYEDLVRHPESVVQSLCEFLGEAYTPEMLRFHQDADAYMKDEAEERYNETATHPITDDRVDAWTDRLTSDQVAIIESVCDEIMREFGYTPTEHRPSSTVYGELFVKKMYWTYQCWRHRDVRHYTVKYPLFARSRTRLSSLRQQVQRDLRRMSPFHSA